MRILYLVALVFLLSISVNAQHRIGFVNGYLFSDKKVGIQKLAKVVALLSSSHSGCTYRCGSLIRKINDLKKEIEVLGVSGKSITEKASQLSNTEKELNRIREADEAAYKKLYSLYVVPIEKDVREKLELFSIKKGYTKIIDLSDDKVAEAVLYLDESIDITNEFIKFCNEEFEKEKTKK